MAPALAVRTLAVTDGLAGWFTAMSAAGSVFRMAVSCQSPRAPAVNVSSWWAWKPVVPGSSPRTFR